MGAETRLSGLAAKIAAVHELLGSLRVPHQFGGAVALAWYRSPRATIDVDLNITLAPTDAQPILGALAHLGVSVSDEDRESIARDGQARLDWDGHYLDVFFATMQLHQDMAQKAREVRFGPTSIPILSPEHLVVCKAVFDRPKDWVDIEEMRAWGTEIDAAETLAWVDRLLGASAEQRARLAQMLDPRT